MELAWHDIDSTAPVAPDARHPRIEVRERTAGPRAGIPGSRIDVWQVVVSYVACGGDRARLGRVMPLAPGQIDDALAYFADHQAEVQAWIDANAALFRAGQIAPPLVDSIATYRDGLMEHEHTEAEREAFFRALEERFAGLREDSVAWAEIERERALEANALMDGLGDDAPVPPQPPG